MTQTLTLERTDLLGVRNSMLMDLLLNRLPQADDRQIIAQPRWDDRSLRSETANGPKGLGMFTDALSSAVNDLYLVGVNISTESLESIKSTLVLARAAMDGQHTRRLERLAEIVNAIEAAAAELAPAERRQAVAAFSKGLGRLLGIPSAGEQAHPIRRAVAN